MLQSKPNSFKLNSKVTNSEEITDEDGTSVINLVQRITVSLPFCGGTVCKSTAHGVTSKLWVTLSPLYESQTKLEFSWFQTS